MRLLLLTGFLALLSHDSAAQSNEVVLKTDFKGEIEFGSIEALIAKIQEGKSVRVGWHLDFDEDGKSDLEHWIDANFITIMEGHVFNQIEPIYMQIPNAKIPQVQIVNSNRRWTAIIGTNGKLLNRFVDPDIQLIEDEMIRKQMEERLAVQEWMVATIWVIKE